MTQGAARTSSFQDRLALIGGPSPVQLATAFLGPPGKITCSSRLGTTYARQFPYMMAEL